MIEVDGVLCCSFRAFWLQGDDHHGVDPGGGHHLHALLLHLLLEMEEAQR